MISSDLLRKIRRIEIRTRRIVNEVLSGEYQSAFKGRGMEFSEVREYVPGDEIRTIDWNVTARTGRPFVKIYKEERELTVLLIVDASRSHDFGTASRFKGETAAELCALLAFSAIKNNDKVGLIIFTSQIEKYVPPKKGRKHVLRVIRELLYFKPEKPGTDIPGALAFFNRTAKKRCVAFMVSDFMDAGDFRMALKVAGRKHDVITVSLSDPREAELPGLGLVELEDAETGKRLLLDTSDPHFQAVFKKRVADILEQRRLTFRQADVENIPVRTDRDYAEPLIAFFKKREKMR
ncbi:MAG: DUF58 domain-containing protein [Fibrobacterota bacterium]